jgi:hypothetical protein
VIGFGGVGQRQARTSFLKKRSKKLLLFGPEAVSGPGGQLAKVFWLLFFKKVTSFFQPSARSGLTV